MKKINKGSVNYKKITTKEGIDLSLLKELILMVPDCTMIDWYIESIEGVADLSVLNTTMIQLNKETQLGDYGKKVRLEELEAIIDCLDSLDSILILGGTIRSEKLDFQDYTSIYENVEYVFEYFDSTEWNITSLNLNYIEKVKINE
ncbi:hypothetical protein EYV94_18465 [Puteibacter caeruleilacunae]|nr:hypothetical protein EYV94_18465 [Puteibacter caeruleilacunae]